MEDKAVKPYVSISNKNRTGEKRSAASKRRISEGLRKKYASVEWQQERLKQIQANVDIDEDTGCHVWKSAVDKDGYPKVRGRASRIVLKAKTGEEPDGRLALHTCNNTRCINPDHLYWGTSSDNAQDRVKAGTQNSPPPPMYGKDNPMYGKGPPRRTTEEYSETMKKIWAGIPKEERTKRAHRIWKKRRQGQQVS